MYTGPQGSMLSGHTTQDVKLIRTNDKVGCVDIDMDNISLETHRDTVSPDNPARPLWNSVCVYAFVWTKKPSKSFAHINMGSLNGIHFWQK